MFNRRKFGAVGEEAVALWLEKNDYLILERNFYTRQGEIDIIALKSSALCFVEVKMRTSFEYGRGAEAVDKIKQEHIIACAKEYISKKRPRYATVRFDVAEVFYDKITKKTEINYIEDAFYKKAKERIRHDKV